MVKLRISALLGLLLITACDSPVSPEDAALKQGFVGSWRFEYKDEFERAVQGTIRFGQDGQFFGVEIVKGEQGISEDRFSGPWYVTDGLLKLNTNNINGKTLGINQMVFFTCKLSAVEKRQFQCIDQIAKKTYMYVKVENAS